MQKVTIQKWGNSYGIRIPKKTLENLQIKEKSVLYMDELKDGLELRKMTRKEQLAELLAQMDPNDMPEEVDWGPPVGKEFW